MNQSESTSLTAQDHAIIRDVERALRDGRQLKQWWEQREAARDYAQSFELMRVFNAPARALGFFDAVPLPGGAAPVMGVVQEMLFDQPKAAPAALVREELREFILHYFLRVSDFRVPTAFITAGAPIRSAAAAFWRPLSCCDEATDPRAGFGYSQLYFKQRTGVVGKFAPQDEFAIVNLREFGATYEWVILKVRIFDFNLTWAPFGPDGLKLSLPQQEETYLVISPDFITEQEAPAPGVAGRYGFGYAFLKYVAQPSIFAYGPGHFGLGFQLMDFEIDPAGQSRARLAFVVNRPTRVLQLPLDPVGWGFALTERLTFGLANPWLQPLRKLLEPWAPRIADFDPVTFSLQWANWLTAGLAAERLCLALPTLEKEMLRQHFMQHYTLLTGALLTWRQTPSWRDAARVPELAQRGHA